MIRNWNFSSRQRFLNPRVPDDYILKFLGTRYDNGSFQGHWLIDENNSIAIAKFFPYKGMEHVMFLGSDGNEIVTVPANGGQEDAKIYSPPLGVSHMITDVAFPADECKIAVIGCAEGVLDSMDLRTNTRIRYIGGHTRTIRQVGMHKDNSTMVATCGKDGDIHVWDLRSDNPKMSIRGAHQPSTNRTHVHDVTSLKFVSEKIIVTGSDSKSGLRFWDLRYQKVNKPMFRKAIPDGGRVMALETSRTGREIYAVMSNEEILEYHYTDQKALSEHYEKHHVKPWRPYCNDIEQAGPSRKMKYPRLKTASEFVTTARASPISDHLLVGGYGAKVYDIHREVLHFNDATYPEPIPTEPKFYFCNFEQHDPTTVDWSADGRFISTLTVNSLTIWDHHWPIGQEFERLPLDWDSKEVSYSAGSFVTRLPNRPEPYLRVRINPKLARRPSGYAKPLKVLYTEGEAMPLNAEPPAQVNATPKKLNYKRKCSDENVIDKRARITPAKISTPNRGQQTLDAFFTPEKR
uniref:WD_REPEATS_REGION domain-containing protein n=1 Tax=Panagrellus redivivus TaxID=6233 RepID=A0A7E4USB6_PANRE